MDSRSLQIPWWLRLLGVIGPVLVGIGVYSLVADARAVHPLLGSAPFVYLLLVVGGALMFTDISLRVKILRARQCARRDSERDGSD